VLNQKFATSKSPIFNLLTVAIHWRNALKKESKRMKKENLPLIIIIVSLILIIANIITSEKIDGGFWMRILSSVLLIIAMLIAIRDIKKNKKMLNK
jgi:hypothetical protein